MSDPIHQRFQVFLAILILTFTYLYSLHSDHHSSIHESKSTIRQAAESGISDKEQAAFFESEEYEKDAEAKMAASLDRFQQEFDMTRDPATNTVPRERLLTARKIIDIKWQQLLQKNPIPGINWTERGPNNVGGRTRALLVDASDGTGNTVWAGGVAGGLWKTTNFSNAVPTWNKINDFFDNLAITAIIQDPANASILYFGTGEGYSNTDAVRGLGIWKTTDGGMTWNQLASTNNSTFYYIQDLLIDNFGNIYASTRNGGVRRSTNGGTSWAQVLGSSVGAGGTNLASDLEIGADGDVYATLGIFSSGSIYKSDATTHGSNTGDLGNWTNITPPGGTYHRIEIATAPSDANRVYAVCQGDGTYSADFLYRSTNGGNTWTPLTVPGFCDRGNAGPEFTRGQAWYDMIIAVDPNNAETLYMGGVDALRSTNGGNSWTQISGWAQNSFNWCAGEDYVHADHHVIVFINGSSTNAIWGTDGGIFHTTNATNTLPTFIAKNTGYNVTQFFSCALHPSSGSNYMLAGAQDNGTQKFTQAGLGNTSSFSGGDGAFCHIDQDNPNIQISAYTRNNYSVSLNGGNSQTYVPFNSNGRFINPTDYDNTANKLYAADDTGKYLRWDDPATGGSTSNIVNAGFAGKVSAVTCDHNTANQVWMGDDQGNVYRVANAHTGAPTVTTFTGPVLFGYVSSIFIDPTNPNRLMVCYSNYGVNSIYELVIAGNSGTWTSFEGNLPDLPVRWGIYNPNNPDQALIATDLGVWSTDNINGASTDWDPTNIGLANVRVDMLQYRAADNLLAAATHGRGLYTTILSNSLFPSCTSLTNPVNGANNVPLTSDLTWAAATNNPTGYKLTVGTTPGGTDIMNNVDVGNVTTYDPPGDFPAGATIYVSITPYNGNGNAAGCPEESFTTQGNQGNYCLSTLFAANNQLDGNMFDISNLGTGIMTINSLEVNLTNPGFFMLIEVFYTTNANTHVGHESIPGDWTFLGSAYVISQGNNNPTTVPVGGLKLFPGQSKGFYVTCTGCTSFLYTNGTSSTNDGKLKIDMTNGKGVTYPFAGYINSRQWNGTICYSYLTLNNPIACQSDLLIPDNSCSIANQFLIHVNNVPGSELGTDVSLTDVDLIISHTWDADLDIYLQSPNGVIVELSTDNGGGNDNYGDPNDATCASVTNFRMNAPTSITAGVAPFIGSYLPEGNFANFNDGSDPNGVWILKVCDDAILDFGTLEFLELTFATAPSCVSLTSPVNGATNVPANTLLSWSPASGSPAGYKLSAGTSPGGTDILNNEDVGNVTTFDPPGYLPYGMTIYVTIRPYNAIGEAIGCTEESFQTGNCIPNLVIVSIPVQSGVYKSLGELISNNSTIANGTVVNFTSDTGILMDQNFVVEEGGIFEVSIQNCN